jgi:hypothetical protein
VFAVVKENAALRLGFALRAGAGFLVLALVGGAGVLIKYEIAYVLQPARFGFWTALGAVHVTIMGGASGLWFARRNPRMAVFLAASLGFLIGVSWSAVTYFPMGLFPGMLGVPVAIIWPFSAALSFAYAAALVQHVEQPQRVGLGLVLTMVALCWIVFVKAGLNKVGEPVDFARMRAPRRMHTPLGIAALDRGDCYDPAPARARTTLDSATTLSYLGHFTDVDNDATTSQAVGHSVRVWRAGPEIVGVMSTWLGRGTGRHAFIENARLDKNGTFTFDAFYSDGFYDHFEGTLTKRRFRGAITTADALCVRRVLSQSDLTLSASAPPPRLPFASASPRTFAQFQSAFSTVYTRP